MYSADEWKGAVARAIGIGYNALGVSSPEAAENAIRNSLAVARLAATRDRARPAIPLELRTYVTHPKYTPERAHALRHTVVLDAIPPLGTVFSQGELTYLLATLSWIDGKWCSAQLIQMDASVDFHEELSNLRRIGWEDFSHDSVNLVPVVTP